MRHEGWVRTGWILALIGLALSCFGSVLWGGRQFGYRDAAHFYYPLYERVQQEWEAGRIPLWSPEENAGMPLLGNPTAAVLYPGKLIYTALSYPWAARMYIIAHVLLAAVAMRSLMRHAGVSRVGAGLAGLSYAFAVPVLFQYCNIVFLVGAAWLPLGLLGADRWLRLGRRRGLVELAIVLMMQTLGGDPEASYLLGVCVAGYAVLIVPVGEGVAPRRRSRWIATIALVALAWVALTLLAAWLVPPYLKPLVDRSNPRPDPFLKVLLATRTWRMVALIVWLGIGNWLLLVGRKRYGGRVRIGRLVGLGVAAAVAVAVMGAQLLPTLEFTSRTIRAAEEGGHEMMPFSVEPHRVLELAIPGVFGTTHNGNRSWLGMVLPHGTPKIWVPSLYGGGLILALAAAGLVVRGGARSRKDDEPSTAVPDGDSCQDRGDESSPRPVRILFAAITFIGLVGGFGQFASPLFLARSLPGGVEAFGPFDPSTEGENRRDGYLTDGFASPYWLMAQGLPGFRSFRYPAKLLVFASLGLAGLAGLGWDRVRSGRTRAALSVALVIAAAASAGLGVSLVFEEPLLGAMQARAGRGIGPSFGPFDAAGTLAETRRGLAHALIVMTATCLVIRVGSRRPSVAGLAALVVLALDLAIANAGWVLTVPQSLFDAKPDALAVIERDWKDRPENDGQPFRVHRMSIWEPAAWLLKGSPDRVSDLVEWERRTIQPKYAIPLGLEYTLTQGTTELYDYWFFFAPFYSNHSEATRQLLKLAPGEKAVYFPRRGYDMWNSRYFVMPAAIKNDEYRGFYSFLSDTEVVHPPVLKPTARGEAESEARASWLLNEDWQVVWNRRAMPRAWVVHEVRFQKPILGLNRADRQRPMEEILYQADELWYNPARTAVDPKQIAWIETDESLPLRDFAPGGPANPSEAPRFLRYEPQRVEIEVNLDRPGFLVLADVYYPGWDLEVDGEPRTTLRANRVMRGVALGPGPHRVSFSYRPKSLRQGAILSVVGLFGLLTLCLSSWLQREDDGDLPG
jgi:hypothetical protein